MAQTTGSSTGINDLVAYRDPRSPVAEAYRTLRTNIQFSSLDRPAKMIMITSTGGDEGKSIVLANLAITFAQAGNRVIVVDCDLRRPHLDTLFGISNNNGLTTLVLDELQERRTGELPLQRTPVENLYVLPSGPLPPNPSELLSSKAMDRILSTLQAEADYILFDSPPIVAVTDAAVLAPKVDGVVLVLSAGHTKRDHATRAKQQLEKVGAKVLGVVLNNARLDDESLAY